MSKPVYEIPMGDDDLSANGRRAAAPGYGAPAAMPSAYPPPAMEGFALPGAAYPLPVANPVAPQAAYPPPAAAPSFPPPAAPSFPPPTSTDAFPPAQSTARRSVQQPLASTQLPPTGGARAHGLPADPAQSFAASPAQSVSDLSPSVGSGQAGSDPDLVAALNAVVTSRASDLHVSVDAPPSIRVDGVLSPIPGVAPWDAAKVNLALGSILTPELRATFEENLELDFAYTLSETARFRVNFYMQRSVMGAAFRLIPTEIKQLRALGIPERIGEFAKLPRGLVLVTGPTGSGKSTTLAALIDLVNSTRADHIVTVEDPIEFMHSNKKSLVNQREVGHDTHSFANALKHVLRQDPDVILIGELRDLETISVALTAAETGHLVFATLHTQDAGQTVDRVIDVFPPHQQPQVRAQLAATLQAVVCQTLVKKIGGRGRAVATEVMITTPAISNLIREGKTYQLRSAMQAGRDSGMHTMDQHLADLVNAGQVSHAAAYEKAQDLEDLKQLIHRADSMGTGYSDTATNGIPLNSPAPGGTR